MGEKKYILPDSSELAAWNDETDYKKALHVSQKSGTENGDGTAD